MLQHLLPNYPQDDGKRRIVQVTVPFPGVGLALYAEITSAPAQHFHVDIPDREHPTDWEVYLLV
jgi:hypothetical protein